MNCKSNRQRSKALLAASLFLLILWGCEDSELKNVSAAQQCLNEMNSTLSKAELATEAAECRSKLGTPSTEVGFIILCSCVLQSKTKMVCQPTGNL